MIRSPHHADSGTLSADMQFGFFRRLSWCALLVLVACARGGDLDPAIVLDRASSAAQQLQSALFDSTFSYGSDLWNASGTIDGSMAAGGRQIALTLEGDLTRVEQGLDKTVTIAGQVIVPDEGELYLLLQRADGSVLSLPGVGLAPQEMLGRWFSIRGTSASGSVELTPDPSLIALQTRSLVVTNDRSYEDVDGRRCFAYDVRIDRAAMLEYLESVATERGQAFDREGTKAFLDTYDAKGTIWIDADSFLIRRISWTFNGVQSDVSASFSLHLKNHDEPVTIVPPTDSMPLFDALSTQPLPAL